MTNETWALYNSIDGAVTFDIWEQLAPEIDSMEYQETYDWTIKLFPALIYMTTKGLKTDINAIEVAKSRAYAEIENLQGQLNRICGFELNPNSSKQCIQYFYGTLGHAPYTGKEGNITTDDKALARLSRKGVKEAKLVQQLRGLRKLTSSYLEVRVDADGRIRCQWKPRGTYGGRLSSSQTIYETGMNLQNLDPEFKPFIVADEGMIFVEMDKAKAEWVVTAYACGDPHMINAIEQGLDVHAVTGKMISGAPLELIEEESKLLKHASDPDIIMQMRMENIPDIMQYSNTGFLPRSMTCRQAGKKSNHALNYIEGYRRFALENEIPETEAKQIVNAYREGYCNLPIYWDNVELQMNMNNRVLVNCFGRRIRFMEDWGHSLKKKAVAWLSQSPVANLINEALIAIYEDEEEYMEPISLQAQVHDSILFQYPINRWQDMTKTIHACEDHMNPTLNISGREFQIATDCAIGLNWGAYNEKQNPRGMIEVNINQGKDKLARELEETYQKLSGASGGREQKKTQ